MKALLDQKVKYTVYTCLPASVGSSIKELEWFFP